MKKGNYTDASWSVFEIALNNAKEVLSKVSSQEDIDEALATLNKAYEALTENKKKNQQIHLIKKMNQQIKKTKQLKQKQRKIHKNQK